MLSPDTGSRDALRLAPGALTKHDVLPPCSIGSRYSLAKQLAIKNDSAGMRRILETLQDGA